KAVADDVHERRPRIAARRLDQPDEWRGQPLVVDARNIGQAREVPNPLAFEESSQHEEGARCPPNAMHQNGRGWGAGRRGRSVDVAAAGRVASTGRACRAPRAPLRPPATMPSVHYLPALRVIDGEGFHLSPHDTWSISRRRTVRRMALKRSTQCPRFAYPSRSSGLQPNGTSG